MQRDVYRGVLRGGGLLLAVCAMVACNVAGSDPGHASGGNASPQAEALAAADSEAIAAGIAAMERKDFVAARTLLRPLAVRGNAEAQAQLGLSYAHDLSILDTSRGGETAKEALQWSRAAAEQGHVAAQVQVASLMLLWPEKLGLEPEQAREGLEWGEKAAKQGDANAMALLALVYRNLSAYRDIAKADHWGKALDAMEARRRSASTGDAVAPTGAETNAEEALAAAAATDAGTDPARVPQTQAASGEAHTEQAPVRSKAAASPAEVARVTQIAQAVIAAAAAQLGPADAAAASVAGHMPTPQPVPAPDPRDTVTEAEGKRTVVSPDGTRTHHLADGRTHIIAPDGTQTVYGFKGHRSVTTPDGIRTIYAPTGIRSVTVPGGTVVSFHPDGRLGQVDTTDGLEIIYQENGDRFIKSGKGDVHYLATGRVCHVTAPDGAQIRYAADGGSRVFPVVAAP